MKKIFTFLMFAFVSSLYSQFSAKMVQYPDVSKDNIVFTYGNDIWLVKKEGGLARKITSPTGREVFAKFSPDGSKIAFNANYDGTYDIYTIPITGGIPHKVTAHSMSENLIDWYPDGKHLLFSSRRESGKQRFNQFYKIDIEGGLPEKLPMEMAERGSFSKDMKRIAFTDKSRVYRNWKRYRGGTAPDIYIFDLKTYDSKNITNNDANDELPMWHGDKIYYMSDNGKNKRNNIWVYDTKTGKNRQITRFKKFDISFPSQGPDDIVFEAGGKLYLMNLNTEKYKDVNIEIVSDFVSLKPHMKNVKNYLSNFTPSPDGNRILVEARGEIFSVPKEYGVTKNISNSSASAERFPVWSPNGKKIAYWSDTSGEYQLVIKDTKTLEEKILTKFKSGYRYKLMWSPDSKKAVFINQEGYFFVIDMETGKMDKINKIDGAHWRMNNFDVDWSNDSKWITYSKAGDNDNSSIYVYNIDTKNNTKLTSGFYDDSSPVFDKSGKYIFFITTRDFSSIYSDYDATWIYSNGSSIGYTTLRPDIPSLLSERNDTVAIKIDKKESEDKGAKKGKEEKKDSSKSEDIKIDFAGIEERIEILPIKKGNIGSISTVKGKLIFLKYPNSGTRNGKSSLNYYDFKKREDKKIIEDVRAYEITADDKSIMLIKGKYLGFVKPAANQKMEKHISFENLNMEINPRAEWHQLFTEVWRLERDFFYDKDMHGVDWNKMKKRYSKLIDQCVSRWDVNFVIGQLLGEMNASHTYKGGGDVERSSRKNVGYLGINWAKDGDLYKITHIIRPAIWETEIKSPLVQTGLGIEEGDYIFAVNGNLLSKFKNPYEAFVNTAGKTVEILFGHDKDINKAKTVYVKTLKYEARLRNLEWIEKHRKRVEEATNGRVGYIYVPSTGSDGQRELARQFYAQFNKDALIIDERWNNGGQIPDRFIELLNRKALSYVAPRDGKLWQVPRKANFGPKVMLINGWAGSGGDAFPDYFKKYKLGVLIGTRTWGGLIGISGAPRLIDGGYITVPTFRLMDPDGKWFREGHGVDPDIEINEDPTQLAKGIDPQLEKAIEVLNKKLKIIKSLRPKRPKKEDRSK